MIAIRTGLILLSLGAAFSLGEHHERRAAHVAAPVVAPVACSAPTPTKRVDTMPPNFAYAGDDIDDCMGALALMNALYYNTTKEGWKPWFDGDDPRPVTHVRFFGPNGERRNVRIPRPLKSGEHFDWRKERGETPQ